MSRERITQKRKNKSIWWRLLRPHTLTASFVPVIIGTLLCLPYGSIHIPLFLAMLIASLLIQSATNMFNEYYDFKRGLDTHESVGIGGAIVRDGVNPHTVLRLGIVFCLAAVLLGVYICYESSWWLSVIGLICIAAGYFYTGGPYPIAYTPFGEFISGFLMGLVIILISFYIQTKILTWESILISIPIVLLIGGILLANNIRDLERDKVKGRRTLAILLGKDKAVSLLQGMFILAYLWMVILIVFGFLTPWLLLVLLSIPKAYRASHLFYRKSLPAHLMPAMKATAQTNTFFGALTAAGLVLHHFF